MRSAIILAAGSGTRLGGIKKQFLDICGKTVLNRSVAKFVDAGVDEIIIVTLESKICVVKEMFSNLHKVIKVTKGGKTRQQSVKNGFELCKDGGIVLIHDAARPFVQVENIKEVARKAEKTGAATLGIPVTDTIKYVECGVIKSTPNREFLYAVQTPQAFSKELYKKALNNAKCDYTDDCQLIESLGMDVHVVVGRKDNIKITTTEDLSYAKFLANMNL